MSALDDKFPEFAQASPDRSGYAFLRLRKFYLQYSRVNYESKKEIRKNENTRTANVELRFQLRAVQDRLASEAISVNLYRQRIARTKQIVASLSPLLIDEYTEDGLYELPLPELKKLAEDQFSLRRLLSPITQESSNVNS